MHILNNYHSHNRPLLSPNYALLADQLWQLHFFRHSRWPQDGLSWILDFPLKFDQCREQTFRYKGKVLDFYSTIREFNVTSTRSKMKGIYLLTKG